MSDLNSQVPHQIPIFTELDFSIKEFEIIRSIKSLERNKSPGLDNILSEFLIARKDCLIRPLCKLFNLIFRSHSYPKQWTFNLIKPIHKKESATNPENYRGIAISSCLSTQCRYQFNRLPSPPSTPGFLHRNVCLAPGLLCNRKCSGAGPINDDVPGAGNLHPHIAC